MALQNSNSSPAAALAAPAVVAALLQLALTPQVQILGGTINFMVVFAVAAALCSDARTAVFAGFFAGLFFDLTSTAPVGLMALLLTIASYVVANASFGMTPGANADSLRIAGVAILAVNLVNGLALLALGTETSLFQALVGHGLSSSVLEALAVVPFLAVMGPNAQTGVFSGRAAGRRASAATRPASRKKGSGLGGKRASGKHAASARTAAKRAPGKRYKMK